MFGMTQDILILIPPFPSISFPGFLTLPTAYVTGNPVECVLHPRLWNTTEIWDPLGVGQIYQDEYEEENIGYQIGTVSKERRTADTVGRGAGLVKIICYR